MTDTTTAQGRRSLVRLLRLLFPHPALSDRPYERAVEALVADAASDRALGELLAQGLAELDSAGPFAEVGEHAALQAIELIDGTPAFEEVRKRGIVALYGDPEVWELIGYEGPSFEKGGYLHRGFDDLGWLPEPPL